MRSLESEAALSVKPLPRKSFADWSLFSGDVTGLNHLPLLSDDVDLLSDHLSSNASFVQLEVRPALDGASAGGGPAIVGAASLDGPRLVEVVDPNWIEAALDDGTKYWFRREDPHHPTFNMPLCSPLQAARAMFSAVARQLEDAGCGRQSAAGGQLLD